MRNLSDCGALIEAPGAPIPDTIDIAIPMAGVRARARVAWRGEGRAGLLFQRPAARDAPPSKTLRRLADDPNY